MVVTTGAITHCKQWSEHHPRDRTLLIVGMAGVLGFGFGFSFCAEIPTLLPVIRLVWDE